VLNNGNCPSVNISLGYLSNANDLAFLLSPEGQEEVAEVIYTSVSKFLLANAE
jgi:N-acetylmuramoyl-L-alanine amidase